MKRILLYIMLAVGALSVACSDEYDDTALKSDVADLANRIAAMEQALQGLNSDLRSYASLVGSLQGARYITSVAEQNGVVTVTYNDGSTYTLTSGTKGETGDAGVVGPEGEMGKIAMPLLKIDPADGYWYISYDGGTTWSQLLDTDGNPVQGLGDKGETGAEGSVGEVGAAPTLGVDELGFWTIDLGDGKGPQRILDPNGDPIVADPEKLPKSYFESAKLSEDGTALVVVLVSGEELSIPISGAITFTLTVEPQEQFAAGETRTFALKQQGVKEIAIERPEGWRVQVKEESVVVTAPAYTSEGEITLYASTSSALLKLASFGVKCDITALKLPASEQDGVIRAFPGAEGGGMYTTGGRGGEVVHVTNLNDSGEGSLRAAVEMNGARTIVFDVCGTIYLNSELRIGKGNVTIAGQTAPGEGITLANYSVVVNTDNVIIRYLRFRMGDAKGHEGDAIWGRYHENIIIDHCSMSWSTDECASFYANKNFTMQWCLIGESLKNSVHGKGSHGYGGIWGGKNASFHHNILTSNDSRNARIDHPNVYGNYLTTHRGHVDYRNNLIYNWGGNSTYGGEGGWFNMVNNYYKPGPASKERKYFLDAYALYDNVDRNYARLYMDGNYHAGDYATSINADNWSGIYWHNGTDVGDVAGAKQTALQPIKKDDVTSCFTSTHKAEDAYARTLDYAGASLKRDKIDLRLIDDARNAKATYNDGGNGSTGGLIDTQTAVGGWPTLTATDEEIARATTDTDKDNIPDYYESKLGLNPSKADATAKTLDPQGLYTNFEMYLHYLVQDITAAQTVGGDYTKLE
ncbi:MAG: hypothetical protein IJ477_05690 [Alistipes sp.]|nr:hypothetical protein [Alistipes sp.]